MIKEHDDDWWSHQIAQEADLLPLPISLTPEELAEPEAVVARLLQVDSFVHRRLLEQSGITRYSSFGDGQTRAWDRASRSWKPTPQVQGPWAHQSWKERREVLFFTGGAWTVARWAAADQARDPPAGWAVDGLGEIFR